MHGLGIGGTSQPPRDDVATSQPPFPVRLGEHRGAKMTAIVSEYLNEAVFRGDAYVIRAEPTGMPRGVGSLSVWVELVVELRRRFTRNRTWTLFVRRRVDDPFGVVIHQEVVADERQAKARVEDLAREIRSGTMPWAPWS